MESKHKLAHASVSGTGSEYAYICTCSERFTSCIEHLARDSYITHRYRAWRLSEAEREAGRPLSD